MATKLTTNDQRYSAVRCFIENLNTGEDNFYAFFGNHDPSVTMPPRADPTHYSAYVKTYDSMVAGKRSFTSTQTFCRGQMVRMCLRIPQSAFLASISNSSRRICHDV